DSIMEAEQLQNAFSIRDHFFVFGVTLLGLNNLNQLYLVKLVNANHAARADTGCSRLAPKTWRVSAVINRELTLGQDFIAMNIGDWSLSCGDQVQLSERFRIQSFLNGIVLVGKFWELADAFKTLRPDHKRR